MRSRASKFTQADVARAIRGAEKGGVRIERVEIEANGKIVIFNERPAGGRGSTNPWDEELSR
jgi:hypothetical protein